MVNISDNIKEWDRNETVRLTNIFKDNADELYDPDSIELKIYDPTSALSVTVTTPLEITINPSVGTWSYDFDIPADGLLGWWVVEWIGTTVTPSRRDICKDQFRVRDPQRKLYTQPEYVYSRAGQDENFCSTKDVNYFIIESMGEVDKLMGKCYDYSTSVTEWFNTEEPDRNTKLTKLFLRHVSIRSITSVEEYDDSGDLAITHAAADYYIDETTGMLGLYTKEFAHQARRVKIVYDYGFDNVPANVQQLTTIFAAIKMLLNHIGSSVDDVTSYSACGLSMSVGEPYTASARNVELLTKEKDRIIAAIGRTRQSIFIG